MVISFFYFFLIFSLLFLAQEIFRRYPRSSLILFLIFPLFLIPYWRLDGIVGWFLWTKGFSVVAGIILISLFRTTKLANTKLGRWSIYLVFIANILEAVIKDATVGSVANYLNGAAGIFLIATLDKVSPIHVDTKSKFRDLHWDGMNMGWVIGYTLWNWVFIYLNFAQSSIHHLAVLLSALVVAFINKDRWLQARAFTLGTYFIISIAIPHIDSSLFGYWYDYNFGLLLSMISFGFMAIYTIFHISRVSHLGKY